MRTRTVPSVPHNNDDDHDAGDSQEEPLLRRRRHRAGPPEDHSLHQEEEARLDEEIQQEDHPPYHGGSHEIEPYHDSISNMLLGNDRNRGVPRTAKVHIIEDRTLPVEELKETTVNFGTFGFDDNYAGKKAVQHTLARGQQCLVSWGIPKDFPTKAAAAMYMRYDDAADSQTLDLLQAMTKLA
ncbi:hypothetical protein PIB30_077478 [Stylosanthes scabra]|uniref:Uncharacterized protein n=1 Tax=Stylosanthes scabra TaxID=79078 RepID=A0ABU6QQ54_9FABA|nr:hypothetical protein [Stylosanthes scabra]